MAICRAEREYRFEYPSTVGGEASTEMPSDFAQDLVDATKTSARQAAGFAQFALL